MTKNTVVISLGGSLIFPHEINVDFLKQFKKVIIDYIKKGHKVVLVTGGGSICRMYQKAAIKLNESVVSKELDWMGIKATKVNAELVRIMFGDLAYYKVLDRPDEKLDEQDKLIIVAGGWKPGASSDNMAVNLAKKFKTKKVINLSNIDYVYDRDPKKYADAKKIKLISWSDFLKIVGAKWEPGANLPFDPIASQLAQKLKLEVVILNGKKLKNLANYLNNQKFIGTKIV